MSNTRPTQAEIDAWKIKAQQFVDQCAQIEKDTRDSEAKVVNSGHPSSESIHQVSNAATSFMMAGVKPIQEALKAGKYPDTSAAIAGSIKMMDTFAAMLASRNSPSLLAESMGKMLKEVAEARAKQTNNNNKKPDAGSGSSFTPK